jgi:hypothetical protein
MGLKHNLPPTLKEEHTRKYKMFEKQVLMKISDLKDGRSRWAI